MKNKKWKDQDYLFELVLEQVNQKTGKVVGKISKQFHNGNNLYNWAIKMRPSWKFE